VEPRSSRVAEIGEVSATDQNSLAASALR